MSSDTDVLETLRSMEKVIQDKLERLRKPMLQMEEDLKNIAGTIAILKRAANSDTSSESSTLSSLNLRGKTQLDAVVSIAKHFGGVVRAQEAKRLMIKAGVMSDSKNATNMTHNVILRSDLFNRIAPGEYRLKESSRGDSQTSLPSDRSFSLAPLQ